MSLRQDTTYPKWRTNTKIQILERTLPNATYSRHFILNRLAFRKSTIDLPAGRTGRTSH